jgi:hypothetical protein
VAGDIVIVAGHIFPLAGPMAFDIVFAREVFSPMAFGVVLLLLGLEPVALLRHVDPFPLGDLSSRL